MNKKQSARFEHFSKSCTNCNGLGIIDRFFGGGKYETTSDCDRCRGRGQIGNCTHCAGTGKLKAKQNIGCPNCNGAGSIGDCPDCNGTGIRIAEDNGECLNCNGYGFLNN